MTRWEPSIHAFQRFFKKRKSFVKFAQLYVLPRPRLLIDPNVSGLFRPQASLLQLECLLLKEPRLIELAGD